MRNLSKVVLGLLFALVMTMSLTGVSAGFDSINTNVNPLTGEAVTDADDIITFGINADSTAAIDDVIVTAENTNSGDKATVVVDIPAEYGTIVPATFTTASLGIDGTGDYTINVWADVNKDNTKDANENKDITFTVVEAIPDEDTPIATGLIDDLDFNDEAAPGDLVELTVTLKTDDGERFEDVTIEAWIEDANGERLTDKEKTNEFNIGKLDDDDSEDRTLALSIPSDTDEDTYYLVVRVEGEYVEYGFVHLLDVADYTTWGNRVKLDIERADHSLDISSVQHVASANAGSSIDVAVTLLNNGKNDERDVRVRVNIPELGITQTSNTFVVEEDEEVARYFTLPIPSTASTGEYNIVVRAYNDDVDVSKQATLSITGTTVTTTTTTAGPELVVAADATSKRVGASGAVYAITIINNGNTARTFTIEVAGAEWGQTSVNPATVVVQPGSSELVSVFVSPNKDVTGTRQFTVFVKEGANIVDSLGLTARITGVGAGGVEFDSELISQGLKGIVAVLIIVLIVLFIMWNWRKGTTTSGKGGKVYY